MGNDCRKLMGSANTIVKDFEEVLLAVAEEKGFLPETRRAISDRCDAFCYALVCFDAVFSLMFRPNQEVKDGDAKNLEDLLKKSLGAWTNLKETNQAGCKNIPPKVHAMVQHLLDQFKEYGGIGDFDEQFVERSHQSGKDDMFRARAIRCRDARFKCFARWEEVRSNPQVIAKSEEVKVNRKRKFTQARGISNRDLASDARAAERQGMLLLFQPKNLPRAMDLVLNERNARENSNLTGL